MKIRPWTSLSPDERSALLRRTEAGDPSVDAAVQEICRDVRRRGDDGVRSWTERFDRQTVDSMRVPEEELAAAERQLSEELRRALLQAIANIRAFHAAQRRPPVAVETMPGVVCRLETRPIGRVGLYIPAGSAPLPSTLLMLAIPAQLAGCSRIAVCSAPRNGGSIDPLVAATGRLLGLTEFYRVGGVQAVAAMAYGTASIPKVDKIFGPGNRYVAAAKRLVAADTDGTSVDLPAGPSEVLVIADDRADAQTVTWDLISQAEHDPDARAILVTPSRALAERVNAAVEAAVDSIPRSSIARRALDASVIVIVDSLDEAITFSNEYAPEHLVVNTSDPERVAGTILNAGSVFLGAYAPVTAGDYASGTNHTLPTSGAARGTGGVTLQSFEKTLTIQTLTRSGLEALAPTLCSLAQAEGLTAHARAVDVRLTGEK